MATNDEISYNKAVKAVTNLYERRRKLRDELISVNGLILKLEEMDSSNTDGAHPRKSPKRMTEAQKQAAYDLYISGERDKADLIKDYNVSLRTLNNYFHELEAKKKSEGEGIAAAVTEEE